MTTKEESNYIAAMSRPHVVDAYRQWTDLSDEEALVISRYLRDGSRVLDLGCGTGRFVPALKSKGCAYLGVDASAEMVQAAQTLHPHLPFVVDNLVDYDFAVGGYDAVLMMHNVIDSLYPYDRRRTFLASCLDRLADGVLIFSSHLSDTSRGFVAEDYHGTMVQNWLIPIEGVVEV